MTQQPVQLSLDRTDGPHVQMSCNNSVSSKVDLNEENRKASSKVYATLKPNFIRTLNILPPHNYSSDTIKCVLNEVSLSNPPEYKALSYTWGSKIDPGTIHLNGESFLVSQNLLVALQHLRTAGFDEAIWIDALCINQTDSNERDSQVQQMPQIYENATLVIMWLGPEANDSHLVLQTILTGSDQNFSPKWKADLYRTEQTRMDRLFTAVFELLVREYWNRLWIVQEIAYAREVLVLCGSMQVPYTKLLSFVQALKIDDLDESLIHTYAGRVIRLYLGSIAPVSLKDPGSARSKNFFENPTWVLTQYATTRKCSDARDRIYGCYGLFSPVLRNAISIDYSKAPEEIIRTATQSIIEVTCRLEIILLKRRHENGPPLEPWDTGLPSWVPELNDHGGKREIFYSAVDPRYHNSACGNKEASCNFSIEGRLLESTGILLGKITRLYERNYIPSGLMFGTRQDHMDLIKYTLEFKRCLGNTVHSKPEQIAFWSTILGKLMETQTVFESTKSQNPSTEVDDATGIVSETIMSVGIEMQEIHQLLQEQQTLIGWFKSLFKTPIVEVRPTEFFEPIYRHLDYRAFFCYQSIPNVDQPELVIDNETRRPIDIGVGPVAAQEGDYIVVLYGCKVPVILRPKGAQYRVIGDAHLSEYMNGEILVELEAGLRETQVFCLQ